MRKTFRIRRQASPADAPYWQDFSYQTEDSGATVATALEDISRRTGTDDKCADSGQTRIPDSASARDAEQDTRPLAWEHSCLQKKCGACAMVIDGVPRLACDTRLSELKKEMVTIEPLRKFPVIEDLVVDRSSMMTRLKELSVWFDGDAKRSGEDMAFEASKCLQCGLCLEVCPNFAVGGSFSGMAAMAPMARLIAKLPDGQRKRLAADYERAVYEGCGKSLACRRGCPAGIDMDGLLARSNGAAVWRRWTAIHDRIGPRTVTAVEAIKAFSMAKRK